MEKFSPARYVKKGVEAAFVAHFWPEPEDGKTRIGIVGTARNNFRRAKALWSVMESVFPPAGNALIGFLFNSGEFPFQKDELEEIGMGAEQIVFSMKDKTGAQDWALKVNHQAMLYSQDLATLATKVKRNHAKILNIFSEIPEIIPEEHVLIFKASGYPLLSRPTLGVLQPLIKEPIKCLFDFSKEELVKTMDSEPVLKTQVKKFVDIFLSLWDSTGEYVDINGKCNLSVVGSPGQLRLMLLDLHGLDSKEKMDQLPDKLREIKLNKVHYRIGFFRSLQAELRTSF